MKFLKWIPTFRPASRNNIFHILKDFAIIKVTRCTSQTFVAHNCVEMLATVWTYCGRGRHLVLPHRWQHWRHEPVADPLARDRGWRCRRDVRETEIDRLTPYLAHRTPERAKQTTVVALGDWLRDLRERPLPKHLQVAVVELLIERV